MATDLTMRRLTRLVTLLALLVMAPAIATTPQVVRYLQQPEDALRFNYE